jgi:hypothetical protein
MLSCITFLGFSNPQNKPLVFGSRIAVIVEISQLAGRHHVLARLCSLAI